MDCYRAIVEDVEGNIIVMSRDTNDYADAIAKMKSIIKALDAVYGFQAFADRYAILFISVEKRDGDDWVLQCRSVMAGGKRVDDVMPIDTFGDPVFMIRGYVWNR